MRFLAVAKIRSLFYELLRKKLINDSSELNILLDV